MKHCYFPIDCRVAALLAMTVRRIAASLRFYNWSCRLAAMCYNRVVMKRLSHIILIYPGGLMDKVVDSGSTDAGSIPVRGAKRKRL